MARNDESFGVVDLFSGAGGFSEGFRQKGFDIKFGLDNWEPANETLELNHPGIETATMDIRELKTVEDIDRVIPDAEVIIGGPPCVDFSHSHNAGKADKTEGLNLIELMLRIVLWKKEQGGLKYWALENVPNAKKHIKDSYSWNELNLPGDGPDLVVEKKPIHMAADFGVPQERARMIIGNYPEIEKTHSKGEWITVQDVFDHLGNPLEEPEGGFVENPCYPLRVKKEKLTDHFYDTRVERYRWKKAKRLKEDHGYMGKMSFPEDLNRPSRTVMATRSASTREAMIFGVDSDGDGEHEEYRLPTVREIACFMSFPINYQFEASTEAKKYRLVGNAVPPKLSAAIAEAIAEEEDLEAPDGFLLREDMPRPSLDLTGRSRKKRKPRKRREDAKYARHVPYLKIRSFRVEIDNKESEFSKGKVVWTTTLHKGQGKHAIAHKPSMEEVEALLESEKIHEGIDLRNFDEVDFGDIDWHGFVTDLKNTFSGKLPDAEGFQEVYVNRGEGKKYGPDEALKKVRALVDEHFPEEDYESVEVINKGSIEMDVDKIPIRIVAALRACKFLTNKIMGSEN